MVDAEHTYFQPCIDHAVLQLQRKYNKDYPAIFGTYQAYLRDCNSRLQIDLERARREGTPSALSPSVCGLSLALPRRIPPGRQARAWRIHVSRARASAREGLPRPDPSNC